MGKRLNSDYILLPSRFVGEQNVFLSRSHLIVLSNRVGPTSGKAIEAQALCVCPRPILDKNIGLDPLYYYRHNHHPLYHVNSTLL